MDIIQFIGLLGTILAVIAYIPQIKHLLTEKCSAGLSLITYSLWVVSSILMLINAIFIHSFVFVVFQVCNIIAVVIILSFGKIYQNQRCAYHKNSH